MNELTKSKITKKVGNKTTERETVENRCDERVGKQSTKSIKESTGDLGRKAIKKRRKYKKTNKSASKKSNEVEVTESKNVEIKRQDTKSKTSDTKTRKVDNQNEIKSDSVGKRTRIRSIAEHNAALRFLHKRLKFAMTEKDETKYMNMIKKLRLDTLVIG